MQRFEIRLDRPLDFHIDLEQRIRESPPGLTQKGMFFSGVLAKLEPREFEALKPKLKTPPALGGYIPFFGYPMSDYFVLFAALMKKRPAGVSLAEAARRHGRESTESFFASLFGTTVVKMSAGPGDALMRLPAAMEALFTGIKLSAERVGDRHVRLTLKNNQYGWSDSVFVGSFEGWVVPFKEKPQMSVEIQSPLDAVYDVRW